MLATLYASLAQDELTYAIRLEARSREWARRAHDREMDGLETSAALCRDFARDDAFFADRVLARAVEYECKALAA